MTDVTGPVKEAIERSFPPALADEVTKRLQRLVLPFLDRDPVGRDRVLLAVVMLVVQGRGSLEDAAGLAESDWRDVLVAAGLAHENWREVLAATGFPAAVSPLPVVLLPGLDGTGDLFAPLIATAPSHLRPVVVSLPHLSAYEDLLDAIRPQLPATGRFAIAGESFSGPLAVAVAREQPARVAGVILCNSFVSPPLPRALRFLPWSLLFSLPLPSWVIRRFFIGDRASPDLLSAIRAAIAKTPPRLLAARMRAVFSLPEPGTLPPIVPPVLFLSGADDVLVRMNPRAVERVATRLVHKSIDGPHLLLQAAPAEAWAAISAFLS